MSRVLILAFSDLLNDARVGRQIRFLAGHYDVTAAGFNAPNIAGTKFIRLANPDESRPRNPLIRKTLRAFRKANKGIWSWLGAAEPHYWRQTQIDSAARQISAVRADLVIANDILTLPLACRWAEAAGARVLFDAHEFAPREWEDAWHWRWFEAPLIRRLCQKYIPRADAMITVCPGIAEAYWEMTGVRPAVLTNAPGYCDLPARPHLPGTPVRMVHHGLMLRGRRLENMIGLMEHLDERFELNLLLVGSDTGYRRRLEHLAARVGRVYFLPPVPMGELPMFLNRFDVGLYLLEPTNFNNLHSLPNKFFDFVQARLALAIGPSPEMAREVRLARIGIVSEDFQPKSLAAHLNAWTSADINRCKANANSVAWALSAEQNRQLLLEICGRLCPPQERRDKHPGAAA